MPRTIFFLGLLFLCSASFSEEQKCSQSTGEYVDPKVKNGGPWFRYIVQVNFPKDVVEFVTVDSSSRNLSDADIRNIVRPEGLLKATVVFRPKIGQDNPKGREAASKFLFQACENYESESNRSTVPKRSVR